MAGSKRQQDLAVNLAEKWRTYGFDVVEMPEYKVPLSLPQEDKPNKVEVIMSNGTIQTTILGKVEVNKLTVMTMKSQFKPYTLNLSFLNEKKCTLPTLSQEGVGQWMI